MKKMILAVSLMLGSFMVINAQSASAVVAETKNTETSCSVTCTPEQIKECLKVCTPEQIQKCIAQAGVTKLASKIQSEALPASTVSVSQTANIEHSAPLGTCAKSKSCCKKDENKATQTSQVLKT